MLDINEQEERFFEELLKDDKDIEKNYLDALNDWDKGLLKINLPFISNISKKTVNIDLKSQNTRG